MVDYLRKYENKETDSKGSCEDIADMVWFEQFRKDGIALAVGKIIKRVNTRHNLEKKDNGL